MTDLASTLAGMSEEELDRFFYETDAEVVVGLVEETSDRDLERLLGDETVRAAAVGSVLARLDEYAVPERLTAVKGTVAFRLTVPKRGEETYLLEFQEGGVDVVPPSPGTGTGSDPDVTVSCGMLDFVRLVTGGVNAALLHLGDRLAIEGDELLALKVGGVFRVPGTENVAVDPTALDPADVAVAIAKVNDIHLNAVMAGGLREVVLTEIFRRLPDYVHEEKAERHDLVLGFKIGGRPDGGSDRYVVTLRDGRATVERLDDEAETGRRDATIALNGAQFLKLVTGHLNPVTGVMRGKLKVRGDVKAALTFSGLMDIPGA
ncbi:MAG: SCP2 sterol-binding domain-containing protein [Nocardioidaceae bacterium]